MCMHDATTLMDIIVKATETAFNENNIWYKSRQLRLYVARPTKFNLKPSKSKLQHEDTDCLFPTLHCTTQCWNTILL